MKARDKLGGFKAGDRVKAVATITAGLHQSKTLAAESLALVVIGDSGNALHPIAVCKEDEPHFAFAVSAHEITRNHEP